MNDKKSLDDSNDHYHTTFDMDYEEIRKLGYCTIDLMVDYFKNINDKSILPKQSLKQMRSLINEPLPQCEQDPFNVLKDCQDKIVDNAIHIGNPRFLGWISSSATIIGAFADGITSAINQNVSISGSGMATAVELLVLDWIKQMIRYDPNAGGILVSGGSVANLIALAIARNIKANFEVKNNGMKQNNPMTMYVSNESHFCITKAANILGIGTNNVRFININENLQFDVEDLEKKIIEDQANGKQPFVVVATAGTVNTGAIDPLESVSNICQKYNMWFHVDAAYGGFAALSTSLRSSLNGIDLADSVALDPHKWLFIPFEAGCVLVKNPSHMTKTFAMSADYLHTDNQKIPTNEDVDFSDYGLQLSRSFRALKIWMSLKHYGVKKYGQIIDQNIRLAQYLKTLVDRASDFQLVYPTNLSIVCFRYFPVDLKQKYFNSNHSVREKIENYLDILNRSIALSMRTDGRALLSTTVVKDKLTLRACIVNYRTTQHDIEQVIEVVRELGKKSDLELRKKL